MIRLGPKLGLLAFGLCLLVASVNNASILLSVEDPVINAESLYQFQIVDDFLTTNDGTISIAFPSADYPTIGAITIYNTNNASA